MSTVRLTLIVVGTGAFFSLAILGWGGLAAFFSHSALTALAIATFAMSGAALFAGGNVSSGQREDRANRWVLIAFTLIGLLDAYLPGLHGPERTLDRRRRSHSLAWRRSFRCGWCAADLASLCARPPVQRAGSHPARSHAGHQRCLWCHPPPQLSGVARQLAGVGLGLSFGGRRTAHRAPFTAAPRAHPCRRKASAHAVWRRVRCVLRPDITAGSSTLLAVLGDSQNFVNRPAIQTDPSTIG